MVLVATSFLTFWLDWSCVPARAILGMGTLLSYFSNSRWSLQNLLERERPIEGVNSQMTALDVWRAFSMAFIYLACAEFVLVHFLGKKASKRHVADVQLRFWGENQLFVYIFEKVTILSLIHI